MGICSSSYPEPVHQPYNQRPLSNTGPGRTTDPGWNTAPGRNTDPGRNADPGRNTDPGRNADPGRIQQGNSPNKEPARSQSNVGKTKDGESHVTESMLLRYIELEKQIGMLEGKNLIKAFKDKENITVVQKKHCKALAVSLEEHILATKKEKEDVDNLGEGGVGELIANNELIAKEEEEYVEALNKEEIVRRELAEAERQAKDLESDLQSMKEQVDRINKIYDEAEVLLNEIFSGEYGSDIENRLENELDMLIDRKQRIEVAQFKWKNARVLIQYATNQLAFAVRKWVEMNGPISGGANARYAMATAVRNNLVAANQNITSAQRYMGNIQFPYCLPAEMKTLTQATNHIFTDMQTPDRHAHALNVYNVTQGRAAGLLQWFDNVISKVIQKDTKKANLEVEKKAKELNTERAKLMREKISEVVGEKVDVEFDIEIAPRCPSPMEEANQTVAAMAAKTGEDGEETIITSEELEGDNAPIPEDQLAVLPDSDALFGNIDELKKQYDKDLSEFTRQQEVNKERFDQGLEDKLKNRRSRRKRRAMEENATEN